MFVLKNGETLKGAAFVLSLTWRKSAEGKAVVRDGEKVVAELTDKNSIQYFQPAARVSSLSVDCPSGDVVVSTMKLSAQMATILNLPPGTPMPPGM